MQALVTRVQRDPDAFRELYRQYFPRVYGYVAARVGRAADAEDIVSEVFLSVVESINRFEYRGEGSFEAWIFRIAYYRVSQFYRAQRIESIPLDELPEISSDDFLPDSSLLQKELFAHLHTLITRLSPRRQEVIALRFFGELRNQEIAEVMGLDERTVASHLCRALEDLKRQYEEEISHEG